MSVASFPDEAAVERIGRGLIDRSLPKVEWTHAAHFAAAFWLLRQSDRNVWREMPGLIRAYNEWTGVPNTDHGGYHETITLASLRAAHAWLATRRHSQLHEALNELLSSDYGRSNWMMHYWSQPVLFSVSARRGWVAPDLCPLPF